MDSESDDSQDAENEAEHDSEDEQDEEKETDYETSEDDFDEDAFEPSSANETGDDFCKALEQEWDERHAQTTKFFRRESFSGMNSN